MAAIIINAACRLTSISATCYFRMSQESGRTVFLGSLLTTAAYEASMASVSSSSGIALPIRSVFHPDRQI